MSPLIQGLNYRSACDTFDEIIAQAYTLTQHKTPAVYCRPSVLFRAHFMTIFNLP